VIMFYKMYGLFFFSPPLSWLAGWLIGWAGLSAQGFAGNKGFLWRYGAGGERPPHAIQANFEYEKKPQYGQKASPCKYHARIFLTRLAESKKYMSGKLFPFSNLVFQQGVTIE